MNQILIFHPIFHLDLYRLTQKESILDLDIDAYFNKKEGITLIEWAERLPYLPENYLKISFSYADKLTHRWIELRKVVLFGTHSELML